MKLAILEDNYLQRENLRLLLNGSHDILVNAVYVSGEEALRGIAREQPEIMLVDLGLPGLSGIEFIRSAKRLFPAIEFMVYTVFEEREKVFAALKAGASGYLLKGGTPRDLIEGVQELYLGGAPMSPKIARRLIMEFRGESEQAEQILSPRETEIIREIEKGLSYKEIADKLYISPHTVHSHIKKIYEKLHALDRQDAVLKARKHGII